MRVTGEEQEEDKIEYKFPLEGFKTVSLHTEISKTSTAGTRTLTEAQNLPARSWSGISYGESADKDKKKKKTFCDDRLVVGCLHKRELKSRNKGTITEQSFMTLAGNFL